MQEAMTGEVSRVGEVEGLPDSTPLLEHSEQLRERWEQDGVLYFRQAVDVKAIAAVRNVYLRRLQELGVVGKDATQPIWTGLDRVDGKIATKIDDAVWQGLVQDPSFARVIRRFLGEQPTWVPIVVHRTAPPAKTFNTRDLFQGRHQDGVFNHGIEFITCWVPLMDIDSTVGGLAVVPGSHKRSYYDYGDKIPERAEGIAAGKIADALWRRPDYKVGDILMFHGMTAHSGLPNLSDRFRLSIDVRYIPSSKAKPLVGKVERFTGGVVTVATESGDSVILQIDEATMVRGPKGGRVLGEQLATVLFEGANVIAVPDRPGHARLVRSVSRKYVDLPASWFSELPSGWVS